MHLNLTDHETELLLGLLSDYLPNLKREVARTEQRQLRHLLSEREDLVESLLERLVPTPS